MVHLSMTAQEENVGVINKVFQAALLLWVGMMSLAVIVTYRRAYFLGLEHPENTFLPHPVTRFGDFFGAFDEWNRFGGFGGIGYGVSYFPAMYLPIEAMSQITNDPWQAVGISRWVCLAWASFVILRGLRQASVVTRATALVLVLLSYPHLMVLHTANRDSWVIPLILAAAVAAQDGRWKVFGLLIGIAGAMKGVPILFTVIPVVLFGLRASLRCLMSVAVGFVSSTAIALLLLPGGVFDGGVGRIPIALTAIRSSQDMYVELMVNSAAGIHYGHSFLNAAHAIFGMEFMPSNDFAPLVFLVLVGVGLMSMATAKHFKNALPSAFMICGAMMCVAPGTSTDYKLMFLTPGILILARSTESLGGISGMLLVVATFAMAPKPYLRVGFDAWGYATVYGTAAALLAMLFLPFAIRYAKSQLKDSGSFPSMLNENINTRPSKT
jgi:hypothetical protein